MKYLYVSLLLFSAFGVTKAQQHNESKLPPVAEDKQVCVLGNVMNPSIISFKNSITVTEAIRNAGGTLSNIKNNIAYVTRRLDATARQLIVVNMKAVEQRRAVDLILQSNDVIEVIPLKRKKRVPQQNIIPCRSWLPNVSHL